MLRWVAIPGAGVAVAIWSVTILAGMGSIGTTLGAASSGIPQGLVVSRTAAFDGAKRATARQAAVTGSTKAARLARTESIALPSQPSLQSRFDRVVADAGLSPEKLLAAFAGAGVKLKKRGDVLPRVASLSLDGVLHQRFGRPAATVAEGGPAPDRFGPNAPEIQKSFDLAMAMASALPTDVFGDGIASDLALNSPLDDGSDSAPLPSGRPSTRTTRSVAPNDQPEPAKPGARSVLTQPATRSDQPSMRSVQPIRRMSTRGEGVLLAYAPPEDPGSSPSQAFKNLFTVPGRGAGGGTAVYDISAKTVTMPDGTRLEAHSGIGPMVDNPRYIDRKMGGPTPPDTYRLVMRESRFHGVEAIRLLPTDGKVKHNRTGLLAHSYLLRGGRAQSHGCVAFKDYPKFLAAFKKGKINRLIVVPGNGGGGGGTRVAANGRGV